MMRLFEVYAAGAAVAVAELANPLEVKSSHLALRSLRTWSPWETMFAMKATEAFVVISLLADLVSTLDLVSFLNRYQKRTVELGYGDSLWLAEQEMAVILLRDGLCWAPRIDLRSSS